MKLKAFFWTIILGMVFISCGGGSGDGNGFTISFENNEYAATFHTVGQTEQLQINLDIGEGGEMNIGLSPETHSSIYYNGAEGVIAWTRELPLGENTATLTAVIESEEASTEIVINNIFQGSFDGGYNFTPATTTLTSLNFSVQFFPDGTLTLDDEGYSGTGTWERTSGNSIEFIYSYDVAPTSFYIFSGDLTYDDNEAYLSGLFYRGNEIAPGEERGYFRIDIN